MQYEPYWVSQDRLSQFNEDLIKANKLCINCDRPLTYSRHILCPWCLKGLFITGLEYRRITISQVGQITLNHQQHLSRIVLGYNAKPKYRGEESNRIRTKLTKADVKKICKLLEPILSNIYWFGKFYDDVKELHNSTNRILYNIVLYYLAHVKYGAFKTDAHFYSSIMVNIKNTIIRIHKQRLKKEIHFKSIDGSYIVSYKKEVRIMKQIEGVVVRYVDKF